MHFYCVVGTKRSLLLCCGKNGAILLSKLHYYCLEGTQEALLLCGGHNGGYYYYIEAHHCVEGTKEGITVFGALKKITVTVWEAQRGTFTMWYTITFGGTTTVGA